MSSKHLAKGSLEPPLVPGKLRLYSMEFCPYAQRARLILQAKNIPHDIVNVNLVEKPEWLFKRHPEGKVPVLVVSDSEVIVESLDVANYLEAKYPNPRALYPSDAQAKENDLELIKKIEPLTSVFFQCVMKGLEAKSPENWVQEFVPHIDVFEKELEARKSRFFAGDKPGMVDYMLWPFAERAGIIALAIGQKLPFDPDRFPLIRQWKKDMKTDPAVSACYNSPDRSWKSFLIKMKKIPADYDAI